MGDILGISSFLVLDFACNMKGEIQKDVYTLRVQILAFEGIFHKKKPHLLLLAAGFLSKINSSFILTYF